MNWTQDCEQKLKTIIDGYIDADFLQESSYNDRLQVILGESLQALSFVTTLEDEFGIQFEDEEIDIDFFMSYDTTLERVRSHVENADHSAPYE
jgi:acyl carrier protein